MRDLIAFPALIFLFLLITLPSRLTSLLPPSSSPPPTSLATTPAPPASSAPPAISVPSAPPPDTSPWGVAQQLSEHTWTIKVQNDPVMGSPAEILQALNDLRARHGAQPLTPDDRLCAFTQSRAEYFTSIKKTDEHAGFIDYLKNQDGFKKLGFQAVGENSSYGYVMSGVHLIEFVYNSDPDHSANQLNPKWDRGCVGVSGVATNLVFATSPF